MNQETMKVVIGTTSGLLVGGLIGYVVTKNVLQTRFEALLDEEVDKVKKFYKDLADEKVQDIVDDSKDEDQTTEDELRLEMKYKTSEIIEDEGYSEEDDYEEESVVAGVVHETKDGRVYTVQSVMYDKAGRKHMGYTEAEAALIDYNSEEFKRMIANRTPDRPYIITVDEFMDDNPEFEKQCITYYEKDDTLCDERDQIIPDIDSSVGRKNLENFGLYSKDDSLVFVRNERISSDFEVAFDDRSYVEAIAGFYSRHKKEDD